MEGDGRDWGEGSCGDPGDEDSHCSPTGEADQFDVAFNFESDDYYATTAPELEITKPLNLISHRVPEDTIIIPRPVVLRPLTPTAKLLAASMLQGHFTAITCVEMGERIPIRHRTDILAQFTKEGKGHSFAEAYGYIYIAVMHKNYSPANHGSICAYINVYEEEGHKFIGTIRDTENIELVD